MVPANYFELRELRRIKELSPYLPISGPALPATLHRVFRPQVERGAGWGCGRSDKDYLPSDNPLPRRLFHEAPRSPDSPSDRLRHVINRPRAHDAEQPVVRDRV